MRNNREIGDWETVDLYVRVGAGLAPALVDYMTVV
jgi:hypothetical protein